MVVFRSSPLGVSECQSPIEQTLIHLQYKQSSPQDAPPAHLSQDDFCGTTGCRKANPGECAKGK